MAIKSLDKSSLVTPQTTNSMLAGYSFQDFELIESVFVASNTASITFNNLNQYATEYKHLQIRWTARTTVNQSGSGEGIRLRFNGVSSSSYRAHGLYGQAAVAQSFAYADTSLGLQRASDSPSATGVFGAGITDILDAYSTTKNTTIRNLGGQASNVTNGANVYLDSGVFLSTDAVFSISLIPFTGSSMITGTRFSLYGIR
jgi:hypothetical protein